ncbi:MAG: hypothetical protein J7K87_03190 [Candidatus Aenigmarchaeota archaeon]|nr:hypothetical protein [Candidatus Aenigmarchaeota archaeon]
MNDIFEEFAKETINFANLSIIEIEKGTKGQEGLRKALEKPFGREEAKNISDNLHNILVEYRDNIAKIESRDSGIVILDYERNPDVIEKKYGEFTKKYGSGLGEIGNVVMKKIDPIARSSYLSLENMFLKYKRKASKKIKEMKKKGKESIAYA